MPAKTNSKRTRTVKKKPTTARAVVFACSRTIENNISDDRIGLSISNTIPIIPIICSGRLSSAILLKAFESGAHGVLVAGCNPDECRFRFGARHGVSTVIQAQKLLHLLGIDKRRIKFSTGEGLKQSYNSFKKHLAKLGPMK